MGGLRCCGSLLLPLAHRCDLFTTQPVLYLDLVCLLCLRLADGSWGAGHVIGMMHVHAASRNLQSVNCELGERMEWPKRLTLGGLLVTTCVTYEDTCPL
jgi:hypothetical protein